jgi:hypothetical protein
MLKISKHFRVTTKIVIIYRSHMIRNRLFGKW